LLAYLVESDDMTCIVIGSEDPSRARSREYRDSVEGVLNWLKDCGMEGRLITAPLGYGTEAGPVIGLASRTRVWAAPSVPDDVRAFVTTFLGSWCHRIQAVGLFSTALRDKYGSADLGMVMCGTSNPHHAGYFIHSVVPCQEGWVVVVSLFEHYTGEALAMDPLDHVCAFRVVREAGRCVAAEVSTQETRGVRWPDASSVVLLTDGPRFLCPTRGDPDGDGRTDTLVLYALTTKPLGELRGAVIEDELPHRVYPLQGDYYLGEGTGCEGPAFRDLNGDERDEITIFSGTGAHIHILSVFSWGGNEYASCGDTGGDIDARIEDVDHDGIPELVGENGYYSESVDYTSRIKRVSVDQLRGHRLVRVDWWLAPASNPDDPFLRPEEAPVSFYAALNAEIRAGGDADVAYELTWLRFGVSSEELFAEDWRDARSVTVKGVEILSADESTAAVAVVLAVVRDRGSGLVQETWRATWSLSRRDDGWKLDTCTRLCFPMSLRLES
jgi:RES domain-containing protein